MKPWLVIKDLEATNSRKDKERILEMVRLQHPDDTEFWDGCRMALDPLISFGVKQVPVKQTNAGPGLGYDAFCLAVTGLVNRSFTGNVAKAMIERLMESATQDQWNYWYRRILIKDLRCGVSETTINKIKPNTVPIFACQLAKDAADNESKLSGKKLLDYKLDGVRVLAVIQASDGVIRTWKSATLYSRNGKVFENFPHIEKQLMDFMPMLHTDWVLDGEITSDSFQSLMTQVHRKKDANASDAIFNVFDLIPLNDFMSGIHSKSQKDRSLTLKKIFQENKQPNLRHLDYTLVDLSTQEGQDTLDQMRSRARELGLEGVMVKDAHAFYECKRTSSWLKIKPNISLDLTVTALEPGTGRNNGRLGALICEGVDQGRAIKVNVGSGFSDQQRTEIWQEPSLVLGQIVEIKADAVTQNQDGSYSLRFPRFERFRGFNQGEKI